MADLIINPNSALADKLIIQDRAGTDKISVEEVNLSISGDATTTGHFTPSVDNSKDLGSTTKRWRNIYTTDLHLNNDRGDWTVIEEEDYLTLRNNKTDKVYKLVMEEIE